MNTAYHSLVDLNYIDPGTIVGRNQVREILCEGYEVPAEIVAWFLETISAREQDICGLSLELSLWAVDAQQ